MDLKHLFNYTCLILVTQRVSLTLSSDAFQVDEAKTNSVFEEQ